MGIVIMVVVIMMVIGMIPVIIVVIVFISMVIVAMIVIVMIIVGPMIVLLMTLLVGVIIDVDLSVKMFRLTPNKRRSYSSLNRQTGAIAKTPLENTTEHPIDGVMLGIPFEVGIQTAMALEGDDRGEIKFTSL